MKPIIKAILWGIPISLIIAVSQHLNIYLHTFEILGILCVIIGGLYLRFKWSEKRKLKKIKEKQSNT